MLRKLLKNKKAQNTAEYALLISLVVAAVVAMQTYVTRALQGRMRDATAGYLVDQTGELGRTQQYEPYYTHTDYNVSRFESETQRLGVNQVQERVDTTRKRAREGFTESSYNGINGF